MATSFDLDRNVFFIFCFKIAFIIVHYFKRQVVSPNFSNDTKFQGNVSSA